MYIYSGTVSRQHCTIYRFSCSNPKDLKLLEYLQQYAQTKEEQFKEIFPWKQTCNPELVCFIALSFPLEHSVSSDKLSIEAPPVVNRLSINLLRRMPPNICGWMNVIVGRDYLYVTKVTTRTPLRPSYGGIGKALFMRMIDYGRELKKDYIELYPATPQVAAIYQKWGFIPLEEIDKKNLYYLLNPNARPTPPAKIELSDHRESMYNYLLLKLPEKDSRFLEKKYELDKENVLNTIEFLFEEAYPEYSSSGSSMGSQLSMREKRVLKMIMKDVIQALH